MTPSSIPRLQLTLDMGAFFQVTHLSVSAAHWFSSPLLCVICIPLSSLPFHSLYHTLWVGCHLF